MTLSTEAIARASGRHPWTTLIVWAAALVVAIVVIALFLDSALTTDDYFTNEPESDKAARLMKERGHEGPPTPSDIVIVRSTAHTVDDHEYESFVRELYGDLAALGDKVVAPGPHYFDSGRQSHVSRDGRTTIIPLFEADGIRRIADVVRTHDGESGFQVLVTGDRSFALDFEEISKSDLEVELRIGLPAALIILIVVFGTLAAAAVPMVIAIVSIVVALALTALVGQAFLFSFFVTNMILMMGLAVGVDYSLFIVSRYREERTKGLEKLDAIGAAGATASRAVFFSGFVVVLSLIGMFIVPQSIFRSLGAGAIFVVIASVLSSLTLLPAVISLLGDRLDALRVPWIGTAGGRGEKQHGGFWDAVTGAVARRPVVSLVVTVAVLIAAAVPAFQINPGWSGISTFPDGYQSKDGYLVLQEEFSFGLVSHAVIVIDGQPGSQPVQDAISGLRAAIDSNPAFGPSQLAVNESGDLGVLTVQLNGEPAADDVVSAVKELRSDYIPDAFGGLSAEALVTGETAGNVDFFEMADAYLPVVFAFVLGLSFILLTVVFRSLIVPIKAILMNLLSVGVAYGLMVLMFQHGYGAGILGFQQSDVVAAWIPLFLFSVLFGLSMDYHVFLLSRIRERYNQTGDNTGAVAYGVRSTAGVITGAALIMVAVFSGFAMGELVMFQQVGFGLAVAVFLDATVVRSVLVPATMQLLGTRNWYLPSVLSWLPEIRIESTGPAVAPTDGGD